MVSSSYGNYGYNGYGGYGNQQGGSVLGDTTMSNAYSSIGSSMDTSGANLNNITKGLTETYNNAMSGGGEKKSGGLFGGIKDFFSGIVKGATNLLKSLADPKTWLLIAGCAALCMIFPPAGFALMAVGVAMAGSKILKGATTGDWSQVGEGVFDLGLTAVGARSTMGGVGKGGGAAQSSVQATEAAGANVAKAEKALEAAKASKDTAKIAEAEQALTAAKSESGRLAAAQEAHVKAQVASMTKGQRAAIQDSVGKKYDAASLKPEQLPKTIDTARTDLVVANKQVSVARTNLSGIDKAKNPEAYKTAETAVREAETAAAAKAEEVHSLLQYQRIGKVEAKTTFGKVKHYGSTTWDGLMANGKAIFKKDMTNPYTGEVRTLYSSTPRTAAEAAETSAKPGFFSRMFGGGKPAAGTVDEAASTAPKVEGQASKSVAEVTVPPKKTVDTPEVPSAKPEGQSPGVKPEDEVTTTTNSVDASKDIKAQAEKATTKEDAQKALAAADDQLANATTNEARAAAAEAKAQAELALKKFEEPGKFSQYKSYLWNNKMASVAQAYTAGVPALQMFGFGGGQQGQGESSLLGGLGGLVG